MDFCRVLTDSARRFGSKPALIFKDTTLTFSQLKDEVFSLAAGLSTLEVKKGAVVGVYLPNCPENVLGCLAILCCGATVVPLDFMLKEDEIISCLSHSEASVVIALSKPDMDWTQMKSRLPALRHIVTVGEISAASSSEVSFASVMGTASFEPGPVNPTDTALIMYTSGTTGKPKGIVLTYRHLDGSPEAMKHFVDLTDRDVKLCAIPLSHIGGFIYIQNCIIFGITLVLMDRFHPLDFLRLVQEYRVTCFHLVPAMYTALLTLKNLEKFDLSSLRWVVVFGAPSSPEILERFHRFCPNAKLLNGWGMTETCPPNTVTPLNSTRIESVGKPAPHCDIAIVDDAGQPLPCGQVGEIVIKGWVVMKEYYKDPVLTAESKRHGWFYTGDLGRCDEEGFLYIVGRKKEMIKVGGQIVFAPEVESALSTHEAVLEAAVIGVADDLRGESIKAFVVLKGEAKVSSQDLRYFAREHLAHFKVPQDIEICESLPKNRIGKIDKEQLKGNLCPKNT